MNQKLISITILLFFFLFLCGVLAVTTVRADDTYYYDYNFNCEAGGSCYWVYGSIEDPIEDCPVLWNTYTEISGVLMIRNVRLKHANGMETDIDTLLLKYDPGTGQLGFLAVK